MALENVKYEATIEIYRNVPNILDKYNNVTQQHDYSELLKISVTAPTLEALQTKIKAHVDLTDE